ncbi:LysR family transcriptional regulator [Nocardiopsis salina]|uniref:LysR family transcriptional regulator n=1 Tax=Nocardiopsis salina TaxID=245836 RepID=UPI00034853AE|nr:LysR family transcriptional regulator [Nocardiopsis salina]
MEIRLLRYFVTVAEEGTVSHAAARLHMTQPALSRQVKQLEKAIGVRLFQRTGVRLSLTSAGEEFLTEARDLMRRFDQAERLAAHLSAGRLMSVSFGAPSTTLVDIVAPFIAGFDASDPEPSVTSIDIDPDLPDLVSRVDLGITTRRPPPGFSGLPLARLPVYAYVREDHRRADAESIGVGALVDGDLVLPNRDFAARRLLDHTVRGLGAHYGTVVETFNGEIAQALAGAGRGVAVVTDDPRFGLLPQRITDGEDTLAVSLHAVWAHDHHAHAVLETMARRLQDFCRQRYGETLDVSGSARGNTPGE